jgi:CheY-like chemotaxis protein
MTPDSYHSILVPLTEAERQFEANRSTWSRQDEELYNALRRIRSEVLKRESGHPFPNLASPTSVSRWGNLESENDSVQGSHAPGQRKIAVLLVDDEPSIRMIGRVLVSSEPDMEVIAEASNGREAIEAAITFALDVIVMDMNMPGVDGLEATRSILQAAPTTKILIYTDCRDSSLPAVVAKAGAVGLLYKPAGKPEFLRAIRDAYAGLSGLGHLGAASTAAS